MRKSSLSPWTILILAFLSGIILLLAPQFVQKGTSKADFATVKEAVLAATDSGTMQEGNSQMLRRFYGITASDYADVCFFYPADNMRAEELLLVKLSDPSQREDLLAAMQTRVDTQKNNFDGYGAEQCALLDACVLEEQGGYALLCVGERAEDVRRAFTDAL